MAQLNEGHDRVSPEEIMGALQVHYQNNEMFKHLFLRRDEQQDASEALIAVMQTFEDESENYKKFMRSLFAFRMSSILECGQCGNRKDTKAEYEAVISVEIQEKVAFQTLLNNYFKLETLDEDNAIECLVCKGKRKGTKQLQSETGPEIAIFMMKRMKISPKQLRFKTSKINSFIGL